LAFLVFSMAAGATSAASWSICNRTPEHLQVAIAYKDKGGTWVSRGWWQLARCGGCANVLNLGETDEVNQFYRAESSNGEERLGGSTRFCLNHKVFLVSNRGQCPQGFAAAGFHKQAVEYSDRNFKSNINPAPGGPVCID
jgi:uncharacterized membrane protein